MLSAAEPSGKVICGLLEREFTGLVQCSRLKATEHAAPVLGFAEGIASLPHIRRILVAACREVLRLKPDVLVAVAFPGLHIPLGRWCRKRRIPVLCVGPPQFWAWGPRRVRSLRDAFDRVVCLFQFELDPLLAAGISAVYYGYPLLDSVVCRTPPDRTRLILGLEPSREYVVFMPGSRSAEIAYHVPLFERVFEQLRSERPDLAGVMVAEPSTGYRGELVWTRDKRYDVLANAACAAICSGTATAEAAILRTPMVVTYHLSPVSRLLARLLVRGPFFSIPNVLLSERVVPELLEPTQEAVVALLRDYLIDRDKRKGTVAVLGRVAAALGPRGAISHIVQDTIDLGQRPLP